MSDKPTDKSSGIRQMKEALQGIDLAKMVTPPTLPNLNTEMPELEEFEAIPLREHIERTEDYQTHCLEILQSIEANTAYLYTLVDLISKSNDKQDELLAILSEIMAIAKAKDKHNAESRFRKVVKRMSDTVKAGETVGKLFSFALTIYKIVISILQ